MFLGDSSGERPLLTKGEQYGLRVTADNELEFYVLAAERTAASYALPAGFGDRWHWLSGVWDGVTLALFVNGQKVADTPCDGTLQPQGFTLSVGRNSQARQTSWGVQLDEARLYARALSPDELLAERAVEGCRLWLDFERWGEEVDWIAYGHDYGELPTDHNFCLNGLVGPDRLRHPGLVDYTAILQPVEVAAVDAEAGRLLVRNKNYFVDLSYLSPRWSVTRDGQVIAAGELAPLDIAAQSEGEITIPLPAGWAEPGAHHLLNLTFVLREDAVWADAGHPLAWFQAELPAPAAPRLDTAPAGRLVATGGGWNWTGNGAEMGGGRWGAIDYWRVNGQELLAGPLRFSAWRAATDNDRISGMSRRWFEAGLHRLVERVTDVQAGSGLVTVTTRAQAPGHDCGFDVTYNLRSVAGGDLVIEQSVAPFGELPVLPRLGLELRLPASMNYRWWYGHGEETYADRQNMPDVGLHGYRLGEDEYLHADYTMPQEHGHHTATRWLAVAEPRGLGLLAIGEPTLEFNVSRYDDWSLEEAQHPWELRPCGQMVVHLDGCMSGLGNGSCGPGVRPPYQVPAENFAWTVRLRAIDSAQTNPTDWANLARTRLI